MLASVVVDVAFEAVAAVVPVATITLRLILKLLENAIKFWFESI